MFALLVGLEKMVGMAVEAAATKAMMDFEHKNIKECLETMTV